MNKCHSPINFHNNTTPALNETNMNYMDGCIEIIDNRVVAMDEVRYVSEGWATGSRDGEPITDPTSPYYHNSSLYHSEQAAASAERAFHTTPEGYEELVDTVAEHTAEIAGFGSAVQNRNLLDNGWFNVNQRGSTSYTGTANVYTVDRWKKNYAVDIVTVNNDGTITLQAGGATACLYQFVENPTSYIGKTVTLSARIKGHGRIRIEAGSDGWGAATAFAFADVNSESYQTISCTGVVPDRATGVLSADIIALTTDSVTVEAVKLEIGSTSTLSNDSKPKYNEEAFRCQVAKADSSDTYSYSEPTYSSTLLWTNASPTSSFANQDITLNLSQYKAIAVVFVESYNSTYRFASLVFADASNYTASTTMVNGSFKYQAFRTVRMTSATSITFGHGFRADGNTETQNDALVIPYQIYGIK